MKKNGTKRLEKELEPTMTKLVREAIVEAFEEMKRKPGMAGRIARLGLKATKERTHNGR